MLKVADRTVDELGRIVLPIDIRNRLDISEKTKLSIYIDGDNILLTKALPTCRICGSTDNHNSELHICEVCRQRIKQS